MSPRRNRQRRTPSRDSAAESAGAGFLLERTESWRGERWVVRPVAGTPGKRYRCPGCDQEIPGGKGHVVAWPEYGGVDDRRHWHGPCWDARDRRVAKTPRARKAPRY